MASARKSFPSLDIDRALPRLSVRHVSHVTHDISLAILYVTNARH